MPNVMVNGKGNYVVELTPDEYALTCAMLAPSDEVVNGVDHSGVYSSEWEKLRRKFPRSAFFKRIQHHKKHQGEDYDPAAGEPLSYDPPPGY